MKVGPLDFILCSIFLGLILVLSLATNVFLISPFFKQWLGDYYVVANCLIFLLSYGVFSGLMVRLMLKLHPLRLGEYEMSGPNFTYWKLVIMICEMGRFALVPFTTLFLKPVVAMLFGAKVGANAALAGALYDPFMVSIGNNTVLGAGSLVCGNMTTSGKLLLDRVSIGHDVTVGVNVVIFPGVEIGDGAILITGAVVQKGTRIPAGETWRGNPARKWV